MDETDDLYRYRRQMRFEPLGKEAQQRIRRGTALVVGCGALGSVVCESLARAGVGRLRIVDRDFLELDNLHRQVMYTEADVAAELPKAIAAADHLRSINSEVVIEPEVADVTAENLPRLAKSVDVIVDGTDNLETRYLLNDYSDFAGVPWVFGACVGSEGQSMTVVPGETPCLACVVPEPPPADQMPTCETAGVVGPIVGVVASLQAMEALKLLAGRRDAIQRGFFVIDLWRNQFRSMELSAIAGGNCRVCDRHDYAWLEGRRGSRAAVLCGRNAVQLASAEAGTIDLAILSEKLKPVGVVRGNAYLLRLEVDGFTVTLFTDGRAIISGTDDPAVARKVLATYVGS
ncbi:MAG: ThiF family adenylyltransferase [Planctomycetota bacterium]